MELRRVYSKLFCAIVALSILAVNVCVVMAGNTAYSITEYWGQQTVTVDGRWTTADEWHDTSVQYFGTPQKGLFEFKMQSPDFVAFNMQYLVEFADNTNDAGDRWQICIDGTNNGGSAPDTNDYKFEIEGHTTLKTYVGTGSGWSQTTNVQATWANSLTTSPHDSATHWVLEFVFNKAQYDWGANPPPQGIRIAMYDASNPAQGWVAWPPGSTDTNPNSWGVIATYSMDAYPEGLTVGLMLFVSAVAAVVGIRYFRKPPKI